MKIVLTTSMAGLGGTETATVRLGRLLKRRGHDIIDCQMARVVPACALAAKIVSPKTKIIYHSHGLDAATYPKIAKLFDKLGVYIIGNCKHEREKLIRHGFPAGRIAYAYNALPPPPPEFHFRKTKKECAVLGTLSRLNTVRAVHLMLDIFKKMVDRDMPVRLNVAGIGEEMDNLKAQAKRLGIEDKVTFLGGVRDLTAYFKDVDILVNTPHCIGDHGAGVGNNILEAGLYDTPVVTYDMAGISEMVVNGETGYCIPFGDEEAFIAAVDTLVRQPELREAMGKRLHAHVAALCSDDEIYRTTMAAYTM